MAAVKRKTAPKAAKPTKVVYDGKKMTIIFGDEGGDIHIDTPELEAVVDLEDFVVPTKKEVDEAIEELMSGLE